VTGPRGNRGFELLPSTAEMRLNSVQLALEMAFGMMRKGAEIPTGEREQRVRENHADCITGLGQSWGGGLGGLRADRVLRSAPQQRAVTVVELARRVACAGC
jgi:hypothetical protein